MFRHRTLLAVSLVVAVSFTGIGMVVPVRILYAQAHGASLAVIGAMASAFLLANFLFQYPTGWLADRWGRRPILMASLAVQVVLAFAYLAVVDPLTFVVLRFVEGAVAAGVLPSARALITDSVAPERRGEAFGIFGASLNAGFLVGPALGGLMASWGYASAFVGAGLLRFVAMLIVLFAVRDERRDHREEHSWAVALPWRALLTPAILGTCILALGDNIFFGFDLTLMPLWLRGHLGASVAAIGLGYAVWALPNILVAPYGGRLADRLRRSGVILACGLAQVPLYASYGVLTALLPVIALFGVHGLVYGLMQPSVDATLATASPPQARARVQGAYSAVGLASAFVSANTLSALYALDYRLPLFVMAAGFGFCVLVGGTLIRLAERRSDSAALSMAPTAIDSAAR